MTTTPANENATITESLVGHIRRHILSEGLAAGEVYMTEADVADRFGASRSVTREAVSRLRAVGILDSRQRKGLIVGHPQPADLLAECLPFFGRTAEDFQQMVSLRYVLETGSIDLAVANHTAEQMARMMELVGQWEACTQDNQRVGEGFKVDAAFHGLILEMTGSAVIAGMHRVIARYFYATQWEAPAWPERMMQNLWQHRAIAEAIRNRDMEQARAQLRHHVGYLMQGLEPPALARAVRRLGELEV